VAETVSSSEAGGLMHGPTFMGNPLACAIAVASVELLLSRDWRAEVAAVADVLTARLEPARLLPGVADVRVLGGIGVIELAGAVDMARATAVAVDAGVWLRPFGRLVYAMPPYVCTEADVTAIADAMVAVAVAHDHT
jgi:adenosylmethionine-8-amino-7-oxononanoate aminotransferase